MGYTEEELRQFIESMGGNPTRQQYEDFLRQHGEYVGPAQQPSVSLLGPQGAKLSPGLVSPGYPGIAGNKPVETPASGKAGAELAPEGMIYVAGEGYVPKEKEAPKAEPAIEQAPKPEPEPSPEIKEAVALAHTEEKAARTLEPYLNEGKLDLYAAVIKGNLKKASDYEGWQVTQQDIEKVIESDRDYVTIGNQQMKIADWDSLDPKYQHIALNEGWEKMDEAIQADIRGVEAIIARQEKALAELGKYQDGKNYDIVRYLEDNPGKEQTLIDAGFKQDDIAAASEASKLNWGQKLWRGITPWQEEKGETVTAKGAATMAAELVVPGVYTARHWGDLSAAEKAIFVGMDALILVPIVGGAAAAGARGVATAGRLGRLAGAAKGLGRVALEQAVAPVTMVIHPIGTAKATAREIRNLVETIAHPRKLPEAVITTTEGTVRLRISDVSSPAEAVAARDALMQATARGEKPVVQVGDYAVELSQSPLMREAKQSGGTLAHTTPQGEEFAKGVTVTTKPGMSEVEQGLFVAHEPLPRFAQISAFGQTGDKPAIIITSKETAAKAIPTGKVYRGSAEMELKFPVGTKIPEPQQKLFTRLGPMSQRTEIWLEKPLSARQIAKLKAEGIIEAVKTPFKPAITVGRGKGAMRGITEGELRTLSRTLKEAGNAEQARNLTRAGELARAARVAPPVLARVTGRVSPREVERMRARLEVGLTGRARPEPIRREPQRELGRRATERIRAKAERAERIVARAERVPGRVREGVTATRVERERARQGGGETPRQPGRLPDRTPERVPERPRTPDRTPNRTPGRDIPPREPIRPPRPPRIPDVPPRTPPPVTPVAVGTVEKELRRQVSETGRAIAWRQGMLQGKDQWYMITRGKDGEYSIHRLLGRKPSGAMLVRGPDSAYKTAKLLFGDTLSKKLTIDMGIQDIALEPISGSKGVKLSYKPDPRITTTSDLRIGGKGKMFPLKKGVKK